MFFLVIYRTWLENNTPQLITYVMFIVRPDQRRLEETIESTNQKNFSMIKKTSEIYSIDNLNNISSFATLNSSMLFMPKSTTNNNNNNSSSYINQQTVVKVMQQQLLKKETLSDTTSVSSSSSTASPIINVRHRIKQQQREDTSSSGDSSTSSQRDSGLGSGINDGSSDGSPRDSLTENEQTVIDGLIKQTEKMMSMYRGNDLVQVRWSTLGLRQSILK